MQKLNELVELAEMAKESGQVSEEMIEFRANATPDAIIAIAEAFRELELAHCGGALLERELHHVEVVKEILKYNSTLESKLASAIPDGWKLVPVEPTEDMVIRGFESAPDEVLSDADVWEAFEAMSGCQQAAHKARLCYAAMLTAAPEVGS